MRYRWPAAIAITMAMVCPAHAWTLASEAATIEGPAPGRARAPSLIVRRFADKRVSIARAKADLRIVDDTAVITLEVTATSRAKQWHPSTALVMVPRGAKVIAMSIDMGFQAEVAEARPAAEAKQAFEASTKQMIDPALIEWRGQTARHDRLALSVYPLVERVYATVKLTITMPATHELIVDVAGKRLDRRVPERPAGAWFENGSEDPAEAPVPEGTPVTEATSLYAGPSPIAVVPADGRARTRAPTVIVDRFATPMWRMPPVSSQEIRKYIRLHLPALRACYTRAAQRDNALAGEVTLRFVIHVNGSVLETKIDSEIEDDEMIGCLDEIVSSWSFRRGGEIVAVNYPLRFKLAD
jgi:hypothetical protein